MRARSCFAAIVFHVGWIVGCATAGCTVDSVRFSAGQPDAGLDAPAPPRSSLAVTKVGDGTVTSSPAAIDCGTTCTSLFLTGT
ncbi:MAG TPA: hypothetical protein PKU97_20390, partial [Kofleriaceae bacterium]|nr:hypothetical protein [Kofleriaceae bacterium]